MCRNRISRGSILWLPLFGVLAFVNAFALIRWEVGVSIRFLGPKISAIVYVVIGIVLLAVFIIRLIKAKSPAAHTAAAEESETDALQD